MPNHWNHSQSHAPAPSHPTTKTEAKRIQEIAEDPSPIAAMPLVGSLWQTMPRIAIGTLSLPLTVEEVLAVSRMWEKSRK